MKDLQKKTQTYSQNVKQFVERLNNASLTLNGIIDHYKQKKEHETSGGEKLVAAAIITVFGGTVFYALSQIRPENVTSGAFIAGSSPFLWMMLSAVVIFLLYFFANHKLK